MNTHAPVGMIERFSEGQGRVVEKEGDTDSSICSADRRVSSLAVPGIYHSPEEKISLSITRTDRQQGTHVAVFESHRN